jgi:polyphenol oxidase
MLDSVRPEPIRSQALDALSAAGVRHGFFTRRGGVSNGIYGGLNVGVGSDDDRAAVIENRGRVAEWMGVPASRLVTLHQVHSADVVVVEAPFAGERPRADAMVTNRPGIALGVLTADCAPLLFADDEAGVIGAAHAGWRGAVAGVLEANIEAMVAIGAARGRILAAVGPCIRQPSYEVAADLRDAVLARAAGDARFFAPGVREGRWQFDLAGYCAARLAGAGVAAEVTPHDTLARHDDFFSHRRNTLAGGGPIGHQLSAIAITA